MCVRYYLPKRMYLESVCTLPEHYTRTAVGKSAVENIEEEEKRV